MELSQLNKMEKDKEISPKKMKTYEEELRKIENRYNGKLNPSDVVREASNPRNPLHNWFDWNDETASDKWRLHQARLLINHIKVKVLFDGGEKEYRKYLNVTFENGTNSRSYVNYETVLNNPNMKEQILKKAMSEAEYWERCYKDYQELEDIFKGIHKTKKKLKKVLVPQ